MKTDKDSYSHKPSGAVFADHFWINQYYASVHLHEEIPDAFPYGELTPAPLSTCWL